MANNEWNAQQQREQYERQRLENERQRMQAENDLQGRRRRSGGLGWWWLVIVVAIIVAIWFASWGWGGRGYTRTNAGNTVIPSQGNGNGNGNAASSYAPATRSSQNAAGTSSGTTAPAEGGQATLGNGPQLASLPELLSNPKAFQGRQIVVPRAIIEERLNNNALLVHAMNQANNQPVVVSVPSNTQSGQLQQGTQVEITANVATPQQGGNLGLNSSQTRNVQQQGFYLQASAVTPIGQNAQLGQSSR